ncbi:hypothetical protein NDU88_000865, partial [Pleurodeles waltl]
GIFHTFDMSRHAVQSLIDHVKGNPGVNL